MTTVLDTKLIPIVLATINKYGKSGTMTVPSAPTYDATTRQTSQTSFNAYAVKITPPEPYNQKYVASISISSAGGTDVVQAGDMMTLLAASGLAFTPIPGLSVTFDGEIWRAVSVGRIYTGDLIGAFVLQLRK